MITKTVTYIDYNDNERTENFNFNLSKAELMEMNLTAGGEMGEMIQTLIASRDIKQISEIFKQFLHKSYGVKSPDGKQFMKSPEILEAFKQTEAYSDIFMELITDANAASDFVKGILPKNLSKSNVASTGNI